MGKCIVCERLAESGSGCKDTLYFIHNDEYLPRLRNNTATNCSVCHCSPHTFHHLGCEKECCPVCEGPLFECKCTSKKAREVLYSASEH